MHPYTAKSIRLAVDIGGTFTDAVLEQAGRLASVKVPTTPRSPEQGFLAGVQQVMRAAGVEPAQISTIIHGTTLATNALIERRGAGTALITTAGFRDSLEIGYESRFDQYDIFLDKPVPLVPRRLRYTVAERMSAQGEVLTPLCEAGVLALVPELRRAGVQAIAVGFLHSYANPEHEQRVAALLAEHLPDAAVTLSSEVCPELREYERLSTAVANAYVQPAMARYLTALRSRLDEQGFACALFLVTSAGGVTTLDTATRFPIRLVESGPSGGAILARNTAVRCRERAVVSYDMGGTTAKICLVDDFTPSTTREFEVARTARFMKGSGLPLRIPVIDMIEIGAGGGSIASIDDLGRLMVGPRSAGADPGPACYARGGIHATVSDADCVLGYLDPDRFAEGRIKLDVEKAERAVHENVGGPLGLAAGDAAQGIREIVDENMANAARVHAAEQGADLSAYTMVAFGGSGPLHAARLAAKLGIRRVVIPPHPSVGSAVGFLQAPAAYELVRSLYLRLSRFQAPAVNALFQSLSAAARAVVAACAPGVELTERRSALMRYIGQGHETEVAVPVGELDASCGEVLRERYETLYAQAYGKTLVDVDIEVLTWNLVVSAPDRELSPASRDLAPLEARADGERRLFDTQDGRELTVPVYLRSHLTPGMRVCGPALVVEAQTSTWVPGASTLAVDSQFNLILELEGQRP